MLADVSVTSVKRFTRLRKPFKVQENCRLEFFALKNICDSTRKLDWKIIRDWKVFVKIYDHYITIEIFCNQICCDC